MAACHAGAEQGCESASYLNATDRCDGMQMMSSSRLESTAWGQTPSPPDGSGLEGVAPTSDESDGAPRRFLSKEPIESGIQPHHGRLRACYERVLVLDWDQAYRPSVGAGQLAMSWTIGLDGRPRSVRVEDNSLGQPLVATCVRRSLEEIRFDEPNGGLVNVTYPFSFRSEPSDVSD
ncbi:MAG: hypothetical protein ACI82G_002673 [Bradymonadia bacterium]|jgi:hypothetical protein